MSSSLPPPFRRAPPPVFLGLSCSNNATRKSLFLYSTAASIATAVTSGNLLPSCANDFPSCDLLTTDSGSSSSTICCHSDRGWEKGSGKPEERREKIHRNRINCLSFTDGDINVSAVSRSDYKQPRENSQGGARNRNHSNYLNVNLNAPRAKSRPDHKQPRGSSQGGSRNWDHLNFVSVTNVNTNASAKWRPDYKQPREDCQRWVWKQEVKGNDEISRVEKREVRRERREVMVDEDFAGVVESVILKSTSVLQGPTPCKKK